MLIIYIIPVFWYSNSTFFSSAFYALLTFFPFNFCRANIFYFLRFCPCRGFFTFNVISNRRLLLIKILSQSTFLTFYTFSSRHFLLFDGSFPVEVYLSSMFCPGRHFSIRRFVPFGVVSFDVLSVDGFYFYFDVLSVNQIFL